MYVDSGELSAVAGSARFTVEDLPALRAFVARAARSAGLDTGRAELFTLAVNEAATNAIRYATGWAEVAFRRGGGWLSIEVSDDGPGLPTAEPTAGPAAGLPPPTATHGRGFWLMDELCDRLEVHTGPSGTRISLAVAVEAEPVRAHAG